ncbi:MAG: GAF domain-containing protein [Chloroflexi bacterium]|nr:GAF domain-containing protein [Chloroflexota bacterium]OJV88217.1 MAG: hypothetical protein BGO39_08500 [Chloroflexi bacterium 54-19]
MNPEQAGKGPEKETDQRLTQNMAVRARELEAVNEELRKEIVERKRVEAELRKQKEILQKIFDHIPVMINFVGADGRIWLINRESEQVLGWSLEEILNQNIDLINECYPDPEDRQKVLDFTTDSKGKWVDFKPVVRDGRVIETSWAMIHLSDGTSFGIGVDITQRKQIEEAAREQRALAEALRDTAAALNSTLDFEIVVERILENAGRVVPHDSAVLLLADSGYLRVACHKGVSERGLTPWVEGLNIAIDYHPLFRQIMETRQSRIISDTLTDPIWETIPEIPHKLPWIRSYMSTPIFIQGKVIGLVNLHSAVPNYFNEIHVSRMQAFADQAAIALENARLLQEVHSGRERLQVLSNQLLVAQEAERRFIARELHDEIGQVLTAISTNLRVIELSSDRARRAERLEDSLNLVDDALKQIRDLALDLRPSLLDDFGLVPALEWYIERQAQRAGLRIEFYSEPSEILLPSGLETTCFRVVQIALTNVVRHARASQVWVELCRREKTLELVIRDNGSGFEVQAAMDRASQGATLGLLSMEERIRLANGKLKITSAPGQGTVIWARFPLDGR